MEMRSRSTEWPTGGNSTTHRFRFSSLQVDPILFLAHAILRSKVRLRLIQILRPVLRDAGLRRDQRKPSAPDLVREVVLDDIFLFEEALRQKRASGTTLGQMLSRVFAPLNSSGTT